MKKILKTKILLADDHKIMRAGLRSILEKEPDMKFWVSPKRFGGAAIG